MTHRILILIIVLSAVLLMPRRAAAQTATFDDLSLAPSSAWYGPDPNGTPYTDIYGDTEIAGQFTSGGISFGNSYDPNYGSWSGWAYSNMTDRSTPGYLNQFSAITGTGANGSANYALGYPDYDGNLTITLPSPTTVLGGYFTNTTYAYWSMYYGDQFAKQFSSTDSFTLTISGQDANGNCVGTPVTIDLAQGRNFLDQWQWTDLSGLGSDVKTLNFQFLTTDNGPFGPNTPTYIAMDSLALAAIAPALNYAASGATGYWSAASTWGGASVAGSSAMNFSGSAGLHSVNDMPAGTPIGGIQFANSAGAFTLSGNSIALAGNIVNLSSQTETIDLGIELPATELVDAADGDVVLQGPLSGGGDLLKIGVQTLVLSGTNSFSGAVEVEDGTLDVLSSDALPDGIALTVGEDPSAFENSTPPMEASDDSVIAVPEPGGLALLLALGGAMLAAFFVCAISTRSVSEEMGDRAIPLAAPRRFA